MPTENRTPEDAQPLARPVHEQPLARPVGEEQEEATQAATQATREESSPEEGREAPRAEEAGREEKGPIARTIDKAQENNWVYDSWAQKARETGLVDKADEILSKTRSKLAGR